MKQLHFILMASVALSLFSCTREADSPETPVTPETHSIQARIVLPDETKTSLGTGNKVYWETGDVMDVYSDDAYSPVMFVLSEGAGQTRAVFTGPAPGTRYICVYPSGIAGDRTGNGTVSVTIPSVQNYKSGSFGSGDNPMFAIGSPGDLAFMNVCALLKLSMTGHHSVTSLDFEANDPSVMVSGPATLSMDSQGKPLLAMKAGGSNKVTLDVPGVILKDNQATDFYIVLPPQRYKGGFTLTVNTSTGAMTKTLNTDVTLQRAHVYPAAAFTVRLDNGVEPSLFLTGAGTADNPFLISSLPDLLLFQGAVNSENGTIQTSGGTQVTAASAYYLLKTDIDLSPVCGEQSGKSWTPIGDSYAFTGTFDGNGYAITNLYINAPSASTQGFFGSASKVSNLTVSGQVLAKSTAGMIAGSVDDVSDCTAKGSVVTSGGGYAGGIAGNGSKMSGCVNEAAVSGSGSFAGGIAGTSSSIVKNCTNIGSISNGGQYTGGILGYQNAGQLFNCVNKGTINGSVAVGGITGYSRQGSQLVNSINLGAVTASEGYVGGVCGHCDSYASANYNTAIYNCVNVGEVSVAANGYYTEQTGGLCGDNNSTIKQCYWLYDAASGKGMQAGIGVNEGVAADNFALTESQMKGEAVSYPLYVAADQAVYSQLLKALNGWAYDKVTASGTAYWGWKYVSSGAYPSFTGLAPEKPEGDGPQSFFDVYPSSVQVKGTGGSFDVTVYSNLTFEVSSKPDWVVETGVSRPSENTVVYSYSVSVNPTLSARNGVIVYCDSRGVCTPVSVVQEAGPDYYVSTDYSADGQVSTLQRASTGNGIDLILMGDAYSDRQIADGTYRTVMNKMAEAFFSEEPYASYRSLFNVYAVNVVSMAEGYEHEGQTLKGWFGDGTSVGGDDQACMEYALRAISDDRMDNALIIVAMNSDAYAGTCWMYYSSYMQGDYGCGLSVAYFPTGENDEVLGQLVHHEAGGHGFSKLADEYAYESMGQIPQSEIDKRQQNVPFGWWKNGDFTNDPAMVKWSRFLADERYQYDGLGCFEGAFTYWTGAWRPTLDSIMNHNTGGFNAPSREAIWYRIHKLAYGSNWVYDYEEFVAYDAKNRKTSAAAPSHRNYVERELPRTHPPVVTGRAWNEAGK